MITITDKMIEGETRDELGKKIAELKRDIASRFPRILVFEDAGTVDFNYCVIKAQLDVIEFLEYYLLGSKERNWLCAVYPHAHQKNKVVTLQDFKAIIEDAKQMILSKQPHDVRYNSIYFTVLYFLNRIEVKEDGT